MVDAILAQVAVNSCEGRERKQSRRQMTLKFAKMTDYIFSVSGCATLPPPPTDGISPANKKQCRHAEIPLDGSKYQLIKEESAFVTFEGGKHVFTQDI